MEEARRCPLEVLFRSILYNAVDNLCNGRVCDGQKGREFDPKDAPRPVTEPQDAISLKESWRASAVQTTPMQHPVEQL